MTCSGAETPLVVERGPMSLSLVITAGQRGDSPQYEPALSG